MTTPQHPLLSLDLPQRPLDPQFWWREICFVSPTLAMSGGISRNHEIAREQLQRWKEAGITDYMPVHIEFAEQAFIEANSNIRVHHIGVDDDLGRRDPRWFDEVAAKAAEIALDPDAVLLVTCWVGCNRGPSATYAIMRSRGWDSLPALRRIRQVRPIAATVYAPDAAAWWVARNGGNYDDMQAAVDEVKRWFNRNPLDAYWVIGSINGR